MLKATKRKAPGSKASPGEKRSGAKRQQRRNNNKPNKAQAKPDDKSDEKDAKRLTRRPDDSRAGPAIVDTQKNEEKLLPVQTHRKPVDRSKPLRDW